MAGRLTRQERDPASVVPALLGAHAAVDSVTLIGSRAEGRAVAVSDWDFRVETNDFAALADDLPGLFAPLEPLAAQWDRYSPHRTFMLVLRGPQKVDLLFLDQPQGWAPPWEPSQDNLPAIDAHFWDWILWLEQKRARGDRETLERSLADLHRLLLGPLGARPATSVPDAVETYLETRGRLERRYGTRVSRALEREVRPVVMRSRR